MTLTKDERYTAYCIMLQECEQRVFPEGLCHISGECFDVYPITYKSGCTLYKESVHMKKLYPEIWNKRNGNDAGYWFFKTPEGMEKRISILKQCIEETSNF